MNAVRDLRTQQRGQTSYANLACPLSPATPLPVHLYPLLLLLLLATSTQCAVKIIMAANCAISAHPHPVPAPSPALAPAPLASVFRVIPHPPCNAFCLPERGRGGGERGRAKQQHIGAALSSNVQFCCSCHAPLWRGAKH